MSATPEYIEDYLRIIKEELKTKFGLTVRSILCGDNEEMRRYQMHKSLDDTALDVYRQYKNIGVHSSAKNGEEEANKINKVHEDETIREKQKEKSSLLQDIPLSGADE